jgi:preprotein translocase subunit SecD
MVIRLLRFNIKLLVAVGLLSLTGCQSPEAKQEQLKATLRIHLEANPNPPGQSERVLVLRSSPLPVNIEPTPFLNEAHVASAQVLDNAGGFAIMVQFDRQGQWLLEQYTTGNAKRRLAIRSQFRQGTNVFDRWLAAPVIQRPISDGNLTFTPDADRTEAETIVRGWNNVAGYKPKEPESKGKFSEVP